MSPEKKYKPEPIDELLCPMFAPEAGYRMKIMRMKRLLDQTELASRLGVAQQTISRIEKGRLYVCDQITLAKFREVFEGDVHYILRGTGAERYSTRYISDRYHEFKYIINRRKGGKKPDIDPAALVDRMLQPRKSR
jgi:DNA-binding XRE family transcriptional regulator